MDNQQKLKELRERLRDAGVFHKPAIRSWSKMLFLVGLISGLIYVHTHVALIWSILLLPVTALFVTTAAMIGHEGAHGAACNSRAGNSILGNLSLCLFGGLSTFYWKHKHNIRHHSHPNVVDKDPDIHTWPLALNPMDYERACGIRRWFHRNLQGYLLWPITLFTVHSMRVDGLKFLIAELWKKKLSRRWFQDIGILLGHLSLWVIVPSFFVPWYYAVGFYLALWSFVGVYLTAIFIVGHTGRPIVSQYDDNSRLQIETGRRVLMPRIMSWFFVGLDYQIEHHLYPSVSHFHLPKVAPKVKEVAVELGWNYEELGFFRALVRATRSVANAWRTPSTPITSS